MISTRTVGARQLPPSHPRNLIPRYSRRHVATVLVVAALAAMVLPGSASTRSDEYLVNLWLVYSLAALGFYWMFCLGGRFAFCQAFFMASGGFVSAAVTQGGERPFAAGVAAAVVITALLGAGLGWVLRGCDSFYFAVGTFAFAQIGIVVIQRNPSIGGRFGTQTGLAPPELFGHVFLTNRQVFWLFVGVLTVCLIAAALIERSPARRSAVAAQTNRQVSVLAGVKTNQVPLVFLALGSATGGLSGALMAHWQGSVSISSFGLDLSIGIMLMVLLGGIGSIWGPVVGAGIYVFLPARLSVLNEYAEITYGVLLLVCIIAAPHGIMGAVRQLSDRARLQFSRGARPEGATNAQR